jgi:HPt (histidine-containing phosphotransfer) domain-containing protein
MDGYVSKPIQAPELWQAIEVLALKGANSAVDSSAAGLQEKRRHEAALRSALGDHAEHLESIAPVFLDESERLTTAIREAIAGNDAQKLTNAAHTLKGSVGIFGAAPAYDAAQQLESMGRSGELSGAEQACAALERELGQIKSTILRIFAH